MRTSLSTNIGSEIISDGNGLPMKLKKLFSASGQGGFTLIELLIVVGILGVLAGVAIPNLSSFMSVSTVNAANTELENVKTAATAYYADNLAWPSDSSELTNLVGVPKATYLFDSGTGFIVGASNVSWSGVTWQAPPGPPYNAPGKWKK